MRPAVCVGAGSGRRGFEGRSSASPSDDWQARASSAIGEATRRSYAQCTRRTGNDLAAIALTGSILGVRHGWRFGAFYGDIGALGYVEEEYFIAGQALRLAPVGALRQ